MAMQFGKIFTLKCNSCGNLYEERHSLKKHKRQNHDNVVWNYIYTKMQLMWKRLLEQPQFETTQKIEPFAFWNQNYIKMQFMQKVVREDAQIEKHKKKNRDAVLNAMNVESCKRRQRTV